MTFMLEALNEELSRVPYKPPYHKVDLDFVDKEDIDAVYEKYQKYFQTHENSIIQDAFVGIYLFKFICYKCFH